MKNKTSPLLWPERYWRRSLIPEKSVCPELGRGGEGRAVGGRGCSKVGFMSLLPNSSSDFTTVKTEKRRRSWLKEQRGKPTLFRENPSL